KGQKGRLAGKVTGWRIDMKSEEEKRREVEAQFVGLETASESTEAPSAEPAESSEPAPAEPEAAELPYTLAGVSEKLVRKLVDAGFGTREAVAAASIESISEIPGIGEKTAGKILAGSPGRQKERREE